MCNTNVTQVIMNKLEVTGSYKGNGMYRTVCNLEPNIA